MQSPGPPYQGPSVVTTDIYSNRNYENHVLSPSGVSNSYLTYHTEGTHSSDYSEQSHYNSSSPTTHSSHIHYNSSNSGQSYGQPVSQYNEMYETCSPYATNIPPAIRQPIPSSNLKYWNSDQMSHNSHNSYNQGIPPPPLVSRNQSLGSPPLRSPHRNTGNNYSGTSVQHRSSSQSPQDWSRSPNVMSSPNTTPSPLSQHQSVNRSPSHMSSVTTQQFSPSHSSHSPLKESSQQSVQKSGHTGIAFNNQNHSSSHGSASNPLQSLQKMVMTDNNDSADIRSSFNNNNGSVEVNPNTTHKNFTNDQNVNNSPDSPYPTYYNLDQNRLCTPPNPSPNLNSTDIPEDSKEVLSERQLSESNDNELKKCETTDKSSNSESDLIYSNLDEHKKETILPINSRTQNNTSASLVRVNGEIASNKISTPLANSEVTSDLSQDLMTEHMTPPIVCKRTESRDSLQSSDSETAQSYGESRAPHIWQMEGYNRYSDQKNSWSQWPHNNMGQNCRPQPLPQNNYMPSNSRAVAPPLNCMPYQSQYGPNQCGSGSWAPSVSSSQSSTPVQEFVPPNNMKSDSAKKKRGRPFGSKNRRNSDDNNESNPSESGSSSKKTKRVMTQEIGINTSVSIDSHGFDELTVVNPLKQNLKRKKTIGPFIRLEKLRGRGTTRYAIVNASTKPEEDKDIKTKSLSIKAESISHIRRPSLLATAKKGVSSLSHQLDLSLSDKSWVCALCHKGPHYKSLGDLFGPYFISTDDKNKNSATSSTSAPNPNSGQTSTSRTQSSSFDSIDKTIDSVIASELKTSEKRVRRRKSECNEDNKETLNKGRHKQSPKCVVPTQNSETEATTSNSSQTEVWVHEDCIVWSNGVYLIGHRIKNLEEVIIESNENICTKCKLSGATLGCLQKSCNTSQFHYLCAKEKGCEMDGDNFSLYCPKHKKKSKCNSDEPSVCSLNPI